MKEKRYIYFKDLSEFEEFLTQNGITALSESETVDYRPITKVYRYYYQGCWLTICLLKKEEGISFTLASAFSECKRMLFNIGLVTPICMRAYKDEEVIVIEINYVKSCSEEIRIPLTKTSEEESDNK